MCGMPDGPSEPKASRANRKRISGQPEQQHLTGWHDKRRVAAPARMCMHVHFLSRPCRLVASGYWVIVAVCWSSCLLSGVCGVIGSWLRVAAKTSRARRRELVASANLPVEGNFSMDALAGSRYSARIGPANGHEKKLESQKPTALCYWS